ncbi:MAG: DUF445 domain-containing protein [Micropepsaceae bacterium]
MSDNDTKREALRRNRIFAGMLLLIAAAIFVGIQFVPDQGFTIRLVETASEAAIIGGLADWFAVTALFRRPLGLPIPHTALIPSRKDDIARAFGNFIRDRFLDPEIVSERLRRENRALEFAQWLESPVTANFMAERIVEFLPHLLRGTNDEEVQHFLRKLAQGGFQRVEFVQTLDGMLEAYVGTGRHMDVVDALAATLMPSLKALKEPIIEKVSESTGRFFPSYFDRKLGKGLLEGVHKWLEAIQIESSIERVQLDHWIVARFAEFRASSDYETLLREAQTAITSSPALVHSAGTMWEEIKRELLEDNASPTPKTGVVASELVRSAGRLLRDSPTMQNYLNQAIEGIVVNYIAPWRAQIGDYITDVVHSWDGPKIAETIELQVGSDLQYIRINGTVVGALIGAALFLIATGISNFVP